MEHLINQNPLHLLLTLAITNTKKLIPDHWDTLLGERSSGSQWGFHMSEDILRAIPWRPTINGLTDEEQVMLFGANGNGMRNYTTPLERLGFSPDCLYLSCLVEDMPKVSIKGVGTAYPAQYMKENVTTLPKIRKIAHETDREAASNGCIRDLSNWKDYVNVVNSTHGYELQSTEVKPKKPASVSMILGIEQEELVVFTVHPGEILPPLPKSFTETGDLDQLDKEILMLGSMPNYAVKGFTPRPSLVHP